MNIARDAVGTRAAVERRPPGLGRVAAVSIAAGLAAATLRLLALAGFPNDHFVSLTRGAQMLLGDWPVRDFVDPGLPLMYAVSAAAQLIGGRTLLSEAVIVAAAFGLSAGLTIWLVAEWCGSLAVGLWAGFSEFAVFPRSYSYPKILLYVAACGAFVSYARHPSPRRVWALAGVCMVAFLFRHDHGLYIGLATSVLIFAAQLGAGVPAAIRAVLSFAGRVAALVAPYLLWVRANGGLKDYVLSGVEFSRVEAARTRLALPLLGDHALWSNEALSVIGFYVFWALPCIAAAVLWARRRSRPAADRSVVIAIIVLALCVNAGFLRDALTARVPDAVVPFVFLLAWVGTTASAATAGYIRRLVIAGAVAMVALALAEVGTLAEQLNRAEIGGGIERVRLRWQELTEDLRAPYAEGQMPTDLTAAPRAFFSVRAGVHGVCRPDPGDRVRARDPVLRTAGICRWSGEPVRRLLQVGRRSATDDRTPRSPGRSLRCRAAGKRGRIREPFSAGAQLRVVPLHDPR
jgi:hypothetical protein